MSNAIRGLLAAAFCVAVVPRAALAAPIETQPVSVTNTQAERVAYCTLIVNGQARSNLAIRPGKTWSDQFDPRREVVLVCQRGKSIKFGPLKAGGAYRIVADTFGKLALAEASAE